MLATVASVNSANRIQHYLLTRDSIRTKIIQTPSALSKEGCGYSLRFDDSYKDSVFRAAKDLKINIRSFYREEKENGKTEYVKE